MQYRPDGRFTPRTTAPHALFLTMIPVAALILVLAGDVFLLDWTIRAGARSDIAARGSWMLAMFLPFILFGVALVALVLAVLAGRRRNVGIGPCIFAGVGAALIAYLILYKDPIGVVWLVAGPLRQAIGLKASIVLDVALLAVALRVVFRFRPATAGVV